MKLVVFETNAGITFKKSPALQWEAEEELLGTIEIEEPKKKPVTREAEGNIYYLHDVDKLDRVEYRFKIPKEARGVKCTYEIEE